MKKLLVVFMLGCTLGATAQEEILKITPVKKGEEPQAVMQAIKTDFPQGIQKNLSYLPGKLFGSEWNVTRGEEQLDGMNFYEVRIKEGDTYYTAVYDKEGKMLSSKHVISPAKLPPQVQATIKTYSGWHVDKTSEEIKYNGKTSTDAYRVKIQKGVEHKILFIDPAGRIINTRFAII